MANSKRIFISDVHLGAGRGYDWFKPEHEGNMEAFFEWVVANKDSIKDLVLLGDIFDTWVCPVDEAPPKVEEIVEHNKSFKTGLKKCVKSIPNVIYINGNHDMHTTAGHMEAYSVGGKKIHCIPRYHGGLIYAEHGNRFSMFNARDKLHDTVMGLPLGYYITRIVTSSQESYDKPGAIISYIDDALEAAFTSQTISESVLEALMEQADLDENTSIRMPKGRKNVTIGAMMKRYADLYDRWVSKFGSRYATHSIMSELKYLGWFADRLCESEGYKVVVLGHSHDSELDKDSIFVKEDRIYANSGYWCAKEPHFVEVDKKKDIFDVTLWKMKNGEVKKEAGEKADR